MSKGRQCKWYVGGGKGDCSDTRVGGRRKRRHTGPALCAPATMGFLDPLL